MYHVLDCERVADDEGGTLEVNDSIDGGVDLADWSTGVLLDVKGGPFQLAGKAIRGYQGPPADFYDFRVCLMSERMVDALRKAGADNIQTYPAVIVEQSTGTRWPICAVNIVGRVAAADPKQSKWTCDHDPPVEDASFEKLVIDPNAARHLPIFRLAENLATIMIHERVKRALENAGLSGFICADPADWQT